MNGTSEEEAKGNLANLDLAYLISYACVRQSLSADELANLYDNTLEIILGEILCVFY